MKRILGVILLAVAIYATVGYVKSVSEQEQQKSGSKASDAGRRAGRPAGLGALYLLAFRLLFSGDDSVRAEPVPRRNPIPGGRPPPDTSLRGAQNTYASNPVRIRIKAGLWLAANPWVFVLSGILVLAGFVVLFIKWPVGLSLIVAAALVIFQNLREAKQKFWGGDVCPGVVLSARQNLVVVFTDLKANANVPRPAVKILKQPLNRMTIEPAYDGMRVATAALYHGRITQPAWKDFSPEVINCVAHQPEEIARVLGSISQEEWQTLDAQLARLSVTRPGLYRMWGDHLAKDATPWLKRKPVVIGLSVLIGLAAFMGLMNFLMWQGDKARERREARQAEQQIKGVSSVPTPEPASAAPVKEKAPSTAAPKTTGTTQRLLPTSIELGGRFVTVTNINGRVYDNIKLQRADRTGVIYTAEGGGGGIKLSELPAEFLKELGVPDEWIESSPTAAAAATPKPRGLVAGALVQAQWSGKWIPGTITKVNPGGFSVMVQLQDSRFRFPLVLSTNQVRLQ